MSTQEKQASYPEINVVKYTVTAKGLRGLRKLGDTCYRNAIFQCLATGASLLRISPKHFVREERRDLREQVLALLKLVHNAEGKVTHPVQARHAVKVELPQFADNTQQDAREFLMAVLPMLELPRHQGSVSSVLHCESCKYQSIKKEVLSCMEFPVPERGLASLEIV